MWWKGYMDLRMRVCNCKEALCLVWSPWVFYRWRCNVFHLSHNLTWPFYMWVMRIYGWKLLAICHHLDKSCGHKHYDSWRYNVSNLSCDFSRAYTLRVILIYGSKLLTVSHHLTKFGGHWSIEIADMKYLICHVTSQNYLTKGSSDFMSESSSWYASTLPSLKAIGTVVVEICFYFNTWSSKTTCQMWSVRWL